MRRPVLPAGLLLCLALAIPAAADGMPPGYAPALPRHAPADLDRRPRRPDRAFRIQPVTYGETDGVAYHAWMPRNERLPIYNEPPPFFPED
ncbi:hypothetical protein [Methylobacterium nodulans]|uniref:Uncharacterized protein n=1 Tax=Methylobacterium nodulans (strain LMG 21967 / CNCM I-2342 / ORS 2060) TaxID=460265 RepID=B8ID29_METNO|nr:hypothetical protein [Methylobacterium nodulans]ACL59421.1 conserved hypothetical protein [Methylobacterium nodulans ORS 2060]